MGENLSWARERVGEEGNTKYVDAKRVYNLAKKKHYERSQIKKMYRFPSFAAMGRNGVGMRQRIGQNTLRENDVKDTPLAWTVMKIAMFLKYRRPRFLDGFAHSI